MSARIDPLEQHEGLRRPLALSVVGHGALFAASLSISVWNVPISLGDPSGQLGAPVPVNIVQGIPLPRSRAKLENPVANPVKHDVPAVPAQQEEVPAPLDDPEAIPIETEDSKKTAANIRPVPKPRTNPPPTPPNQVGSSTGGRLNSPLLGGQQTKGGTGGVGFGSGSPFGARFGWYADALQRRLADEWSRTLGQVSGSSSRGTIVSFHITRSGAIEKPQIVASSGNRALDYSAVRAVVNTNPFRPLPRELGKSFIRVEITFQLQ